MSALTVAANSERRRRRTLSRDSAEPLGNPIRAIRQRTANTVIYHHETNRRLPGVPIGPRPVWRVGDDVLESELIGAAATAA